MVLDGDTELGDLIVSFVVARSSITRISNRRSSFTIPCRQVRAHSWKSRLKSGRGMRATSGSKSIETTNDVGSFNFDACLDSQSAVSRPL